MKCSRCFTACFGNIRVDRARSCTAIVNILGDTSDEQYPIYRTNTAPDDSGPSVRELETLHLHD